MNSINLDLNSIDLFKFNQKVQKMVKIESTFLIKFDFFDAFINIFNGHFDLLINFLIKNGQKISKAG